MNSPKIIVIVVTFNGSKWVDKCFTSLRNSVIPLKTIVIDNASSDDTKKDITRNFPEVLYFGLKQNKGFGFANNVGIKMAYDEGADYVFLLNQDAWIEPNTIKLLVDQHKKNSQYGIISPMQLNADGSDIDKYFINYLIPTRCPNLFSDMCLKKDTDKVYSVENTNAAAWLISRECIRKVGGFSPTFFHYGEDDNYIHRVHFYNFKSGVYPTAIVYHDREPRQKNIFFTDHSSVLNRLLIVEFSDPLLNKNITKEKVLFLQKAITSFIKRNIDEARKMFGYFKTLSDKGKVIQKNRNESVSGKELCFLDENLNDSIYG